MLAITQCIPFDQIVNFYFGYTSDQGLLEFKCILQIIWSVHLYL